MPLFAAFLAAGSVLTASASGTTGSVIRIEPVEQPVGILGDSLAYEALSAVQRSLLWLAAQQKADGSWSNGAFPALTALPLQAFIRAGWPRDRDPVQRAVGFILGGAQPDGRIATRVSGPGSSGLDTYNTAVCMTTLFALEDPALEPVIRRARQFVASSQYFGSDGKVGAFGYVGSGRGSTADLLNTLHAAEAMRLTENLSATNRVPGGDPDLRWDVLIRYVEAFQPGGVSTNRTDPASPAAAPQPVLFRSYGSMTYVGLLSLIYARVSRDDPRVLSAFDWAVKHWSLDENPGMGSQGLYFFYHVLAKALTAYDCDLIPLADGSLLDWRTALTCRLIARQKIDPATGGGYWVNDHGQFWESDPVLVTSYAVLSLQMLLEQGHVRPPSAGSPVRD
jgi:squalene-hopene/tetraprenyl-beta-curcumene cyclase